MLDYMLSDTYTSSGGIIGSRTKWGFLIGGIIVIVLIIYFLRKKR